MAKRVYPSLRCNHETNCTDIREHKECADRGLHYSQMCPGCQLYWSRAAAMVGIKSVDEYVAEATERLPRVIEQPTHVYVKIPLHSVQAAYKQWEDGAITDLEFSAWLIVRARGEMPYDLAKLLDDIHTQIEKIDKENALRGVGLSAAKLAELLALYPVEPAKEE